jgi:hypothetical protein
MSREELKLRFQSLGFQLMRNTWARASHPDEKKSGAVQRLEGFADSPDAFSWWPEHMHDCVPIVTRMKQSKGRASHANQLFLNIFCESRQPRNVKSG